MRTEASLILLALTTCLSWGRSPMHMVQAQVATGHTDLVSPIHHSHSELRGRMDMLEHSAGALATTEDHIQESRSGRQLTFFPAVSFVTNLAGSVLDAFLGVGVGAITDAIFGSQTVPIDLTQLIEDALEEIDRIVGDVIEKAFNAQQQAKLNSLILQVREYTRRNNLEGSRDDVQDMLRLAADLLTFFESNGVVTNSAFQTTLALRLTLLLELFQLDQLIGESPATLEVAESNIRAQAANGKASLERWASSFEPATNEVDVRTSSPCAVRSRSGSCSALSSKIKDRTVCMVLGSPGLEDPDEFCVRERCQSNFFFGRGRKNRLNKCLRSATNRMRRAVESHAADIGIMQFRERNLDTIFGEGFENFLVDLGSVEELKFVDVSLPDVGTPAADAPTADA